MPLLPIEPYIFPSTLLTDSAAVDGKRWFALHTKPRAEKSLARRLLGRNVEFFLPLYHRQLRSGGRLRLSYLPLSPSYLFLRGDDDARRIALESNLIVRTLHVEDQQQLHEDLAHVAQLMEHGSALSPEARLLPGTRVEIISGPLAGMEGTILKHAKQLKFYVEVRLLQQGVSVEIESWMFRPLAAPHAALSRA